MHTITEKELSNGMIQSHPAKSQTKYGIGIMSSKGGVGKSLITALLACDLARKGYQVGILDADFIGSSIPSLFGLKGPAQAGQYSFLPHQSRTGIKVISTNLLFTDEGQSVIWKEDLVGQVIKELWKEVEWGTLDFLLMDMPPATSEVSVDLMKSLPLDGVLIVTTPQALSVSIVNKAVYTAKKIEIPILGIVENLAYYQSPDTGKPQYIFGESHGASLAHLAETTLLAQIPLDSTLASFCEDGKIEDAMLEEGSHLGNSFLASLTRNEENRALQIQESQIRAAEAATFEAENITVGKEPEFLSMALDRESQPFSDIVMHLIYSKENMGELDHPSAQGLFMGSCGDRMQIELKIITGRIIEAKFLADGCGATLACGSMITKMACAKTLDQANQITPDDLYAALGGLPEDHAHCAELAVMTLREAVIDAIEGHRTIAR
jgi:Mrp family chromosome partitioning ATPase/NifU-like protein involved in Fe-S cluster formation